MRTVVETKRVGGCHPSQADLQWLIDQAVNGCGTDPGDVADLNNLLTGRLAATRLKPALKPPYLAAIAFVSVVGNSVNLYFLKYQHHDVVSLIVGNVNLFIALFYVWGVYRWTTRIAHAATRRVWWREEKVVGIAGVLILAAMVLTDVWTN